MLLPKHYKALYDIALAGFRRVRQQTLTTPSTPDLCHSGSFYLLYDQFAFPCAPDGIHSMSVAPLYQPFEDITVVDSCKTDGVAPPIPPLDSSQFALFSFAFGSYNSTWTCICSDLEMRDTLQRHALFFRPLFFEPQLGRRKFRIAETADGRGLGVFATHAIARGEIIFREPPLIVADQGVERVVHSMDEMIGYAMHPRARRAFDALHNSWPALPRSRILGILRTNQYCVSLPGSDKIYGGTFEILSRINHSCAPNVAYTWDVESFQGVLEAWEDIPAGQEILNSYIDIQPPKSERRKELLMKYKFLCKCSRCGFK